MRRNDDIGIHERGNRMKLKKVFFDLDGTLTVVVKLFCNTCG